VLHLVVQLLIQIPRFAIESVTFFDPNVSLSGSYAGTPQLMASPPTSNRIMTKSSIRNISIRISLKTTMKILLTAFLIVPTKW